MGYYRSLKCSFHVYNCQFTPAHQASVHWETATGNWVLCLIVFDQNHKNMAWLSRKKLARISASGSLLVLRYKNVFMFTLSSTESANPFFPPPQSTVCFFLGSSHSTWGAMERYFIINRVAEIHRSDMSSKSISSPLPYPLACLNFETQRRLTDADSRFGMQPFDLGLGDMTEKYIDM